MYFLPTNSNPFLNNRCLQFVTQSPVSVSVSTLLKALSTGKANFYRRFCQDITFHTNVVINWEFIIIISQLIHPKNSYTLLCAGFFQSFLLPNLGTEGTGVLTDPGAPLYSPSWQCFSIVHWASLTGGKVHSHSRQKRQFLTKGSRFPQKNLGRFILWLESNPAAVGEKVKA